MNLKTKSVLIYDYGLFVSLAELLVGSFAKVGYFRPWETSFFPTGSELMSGSGLEGIERVENFFESVDDYDLIVFPGVQDSTLQQWLVKKGYRVWGSLGGAQLELSRWKTREILKEVKLPVSPAVQLEGIDALKQYLKTHKDVFVKISTFRGLGETWHHENYEMSEPQLNAMASEYGTMGKLITFVVEDTIPKAKEIGYDGFCIDGQFPKVGASFGVEVKDEAYFTKIMDYSELPSEVRLVNNKLIPSLKKMGYRNFFSTEIRMTDKPYLIDLTCRHASPAGEIICALYENLAEILWFGAEGILIEPKVKNKFGAQIIITSEWAERYWQPIYFPKEIRPFVKLYNHCIIEGVDYIVPQPVLTKAIGSIVTLGTTEKEAIDKCKSMAKLIKGFDVTVKEGALDKAIEIFHKAV